MPYTAEINRINPSSLIFLIDQSTSMAEPWGADPAKTKASGVADNINRLLRNLVLKLSRGPSGEIFDWFHVGVIGYSSRADFALGGELSGRRLVPLSEVAIHPLRVEERTESERTIRFPVWFETIAQGATHMCEALELAKETATAFIGQFPRCFPPIVFNITDGDANDGDPEPRANSLREVTSEDGNLLVFNLHISSETAEKVEFPESEAGLPDEFARQLFRMSSVLPSRMQELARGEGFQAGRNSRGFVFNGDMTSVYNFLEMGTRIRA